MTTDAESGILKQCCAAAYESDFARLLLGDSAHPGGLNLTRRLGELLELRPGMRVLDVASGTGESAVFLAKEFGCEVRGLDFSEVNVRRAAMRAAASGVAELTAFHSGDAESMHFPDDSFDRIICECAFCTFPDKSAAAGEFFRVLRDNGRIGISDLTRLLPLPPDLAGLLSWIACIADARPVAEYIACLEKAGFRIGVVETHNDALARMANDVQGRLLGLELINGLKKIELPGADFTRAKQVAQSAMRAIQNRVLGYSLIVAGVAGC